MIEKHNGRSFDMELIANGDVVFDVGCRGFDLWKMLEHRCNVLNIDADPSVDDETPDRAQLVTCALVSAARAARGRVELHLRDDPQAHTIIGGAGKSIDVPAKSLKQLMLQFAVDQIGLLKLNCEGAEYEIMLDIARMGPVARQITVSYHDFCGLNPTPDMRRWYNTMHGQLSEWYDISRFEKEVPPWGGSPAYIDCCYTLRKEFWL